MIRVVIADDQEETRLGFRWSLEPDPDIVVVGEAADGLEAIESVRLNSPDVVLMDVRMPILDGLCAAERILRESEAKVLVVTTFDLDDYAFTALEFGASGFLTKGLTAQELVAAVKAVAGGDAVLAPRVTAELLRRRGLRRPPNARMPVLTPRERDFVELVAAGMTNAEIAQHLTLAVGGVRVSISRLLAKLGLRDRVQLVIFAYDNGIV